MVETMYAADGVGLAACQIGVDLAVFVFDCPDDSGQHTVGVVCNPELQLPEGKDRQLDEGDEGCLSYPGAFVECARPDSATVTGFGAGRRRRWSSPAPACWRAASSTRPTTPAAPSSATGCPTKLRKKLQKAMEKAADDYPPDWPA